MAIASCEGCSVKAVELVIIKLAPDLGALSTILALWASEC
jgi:hypothetical protein